MKKIGVLIFGLLFLSIFSFVLAQDSPSAPGGAEQDMEAIQGAVDEIPIDEGGEINKEQIMGYKSKAEERIAKINEYIGPITNMLFGVELTLSWVFVFAFILWVFLIELIVVPVSEIFEFNVFASLGVAAIIASLAMQGLSDTFVVWINSLITTWWIGILAIFSAIIVGMIYAFIMHIFGKKIKEAKEKAAKEKTAQDRAVISASAEVEKKSLENYGKK